MTRLSIIIVSYNTSSLTRECLKSIESSLSNYPVKTEVIVVDNNSSDDSLAVLEDYKKTKFFSLKILENDENVGFGRANNIGLKQAHGEYVLFLNSDTLVHGANFQELLKVMDEDLTIGVLTVRVNLENGRLDPASHRGFPTVWRSLTYFSQLEKLTSQMPLVNRLFGGYHLTHLNLRTPHEIDSPSGAFFLSRKVILDQLQGFDEAYFMYGEDLDLAKRIKEKGYKVVFYPLQSIIHLKGKSGMKQTDRVVKKQTNAHFYTAMKTFYDKHYGRKNPFFVNMFIHWMIDLKSGSLTSEAAPRDSSEV